MKKILFIEPFYKGSHKYFADSLKKYSSHQIDLATKNGVFWKWRVQQSSISFELEADHDYDIVLSTNMVNLAAWSGINRKNIGNAKLVHYFHENQLTYPVSHNKDNNFYGFIDITSALSADYVLFNSNFHKRSFLEGIEKLSKKLPDNIPKSCIEAIDKKSSVLPIGLNISKLQKEKQSFQNTKPLILWNHRHEYDKGPDLFFETLYEISNQGIDFDLVVLGKSPKKPLDIFETAKDKLKKHILQWGTVDSFSEYARWLCRADILPVTSNHDFFGISVLEAAACGCDLLLPNKNAYPDHFNPKDYPEHFYQTEDEFLEKLIEKMKRPSPNSDHQKLACGFEWSELTSKYDEFFNNIL